MHALALTLLLLSTLMAGAQTCSQSSKAAAAERLHQAQAKTLAFEAAPMDSGVPAGVAPLLVDLKNALVEASDAELACESTAAAPTKLQADLNAFLSEATPGSSVPKEPVSEGRTTVDNDFKPVKGLYGNEIKVQVSELFGPPRLVEVTFTNDVTCGDDSQLLIYEAKGDHWTRALRWSADFGQGNGSSAAWIPSTNSAWGDFFLTGILTPDEAHPEDWRAVVAHGTPWCTSRFSRFGLALLAPSAKGRARVIWQTDRGYSRGGDSAVRMKASGDTFELRMHADEMSFNEDGFERLVVYRYRVSGDKIIRLQPIAAHARGFIEEWLEMPWEEALAQSDAAQAGKLERVHKEYEHRYRDKDAFTSWASGPVQVCTTPDHFQVKMTTARNRIVPGKPGGESTDGPTYYFQLQQGQGYRLLDITTTSDPTCHGADLMRNR